MPASVPAGTAGNSEGPRDTPPRSKLPRPRTAGRRWTSFVADPPEDDKPVRGLHDQANPQHRLRVEHDPDTLLLHLSDEDGRGWTTIVIDRATRRYEVAQERRQSDAARLAYDALYEPRRS